MENEQDLCARVTKALRASGGEHQAMIHLVPISIS